MDRHNDNDIATLFRHIKEEYAFSEDVMSEDSERVRRLKYIIDNKLTLVDKTIILLYADCMSLRKVAKLMNLSHTTIATEVNRIKKIIKKEYEDIH